MFPSRRRVTGSELDDAVQVSYRGLDLSAPGLEQRKLVLPARLLVIQAGGDFVVRGSLDEQAVGLEAHRQPSPARGVGPIGVDRCGQFIEESGDRRVELTKRARVGRRRTTFASDAE